MSKHFAEFHLRPIKQRLEAQTISNSQLERYIRDIGIQCRQSIPNLPEFTEPALQNAVQSVTKNMTPDRLYTFILQMATLMPDLKDEEIYASYISFRNSLVTDADPRIADTQVLREVDAIVLGRTNRLKQLCYSAHGTDTVMVYHNIVMKTLDRYLGVCHQLSPAETVAWHFWCFHWKTPYQEARVQLLAAQQMDELVQAVPWWQPNSQLLLTPSTTGPQEDLNVCLHGIIAPDMDEYINTHMTVLLNRMQTMHADIGNAVLLLRQAVSCPMEQFEQNLYAVLRAYLQEQDRDQRTNELAVIMVLCVLCNRLRNEDVIHSNAQVFFGVSDTSDIIPILPTDVLSPAMQSSASPETTMPIAVPLNATPNNKRRGTPLFKPPKTLLQDIKRLVCMYPSVPPRSPCSPSIRPTILPVCVSYSVSNKTSSEKHTHTVSIYFASTPRK
jgi:hypothetical protein